MIRTIIREACAIAAIIAFMSAIVLWAAAATAQPAPDAGRCTVEAQAYAASVWHMDTRLKVPLWAAIGAVVGRPGWFAVLAANAESPRERLMLADYYRWCMGGYAGDPPRSRSVLLELF